MKTLLKSLLIVVPIILFAGFDVSNNSGSYDATEIIFKHDCQQVYRWKVKVMRDEDAANVDLTPSMTYEKISDITSLPYFYPKFSANRYAEEFSTVKFKCHIKEYKEENGTAGDNDFHVVLEDINDPSITMVAEIPDPTCTKAKHSPYVNDFKQARQMIKDNTIPGGTGGWKNVTNKEYTVYGVLYRDKSHGSQEFQSPNFIEIHPVLEIK